MSVTRNGAVYALRGLRPQLADRGVVLNADAVDALALYDRLDQNPPAAPDDLRTAILAETPPKRLNEMLLANLAATIHRSAWDQARTDAAVLVLRAIGADAEVFEQLKALAEKQIEHLNRVDELDGARLEDLVRDGRHEDAQLVASVDVAAAELNALWDLRGTLFYDRSGWVVGYTDASSWYDPQVAATAPMRYDADMSTRLLGGLRVGARLWFPTQGEAIERAEQIVAAARAASVPSNGEAVLPASV